MDSNNFLAINIKSLHIFLVQKIDIYFLATIDSIPQVLADFARIFNPDNLKPLGVVVLFRVLHYTQQNSSAIRIGKSGVCVPQRTWHTFRGFFTL